MSQPRFVESSVSAAGIPDAAYAMSVLIYLDEAAQGAHMSVTFTGMTLKVVASEVFQMSGFLGDKFNCTLGSKRDINKPIRLTVYAKTEVHVKAVLLGQ